MPDKANEVLANLADGDVEKAKEFRSILYVGAKFERTVNVLRA